MLYRRCIAYCASLLPLVVVASCSSESRPPPSSQQSAYDAGVAAKDAASNDASLEAGVDGGGATDGGVTALVFDPKRVYLRGTLAVGEARIAMADLATPNTFVVGGDVDLFPVVSPSGGLLFTRNEGPERKVRTFVPDPPPTLQGTTVTNYPTQPYANDPVVTVPVCPTTVSTVTVRPDTAKIVYVCNNSSDARDDTGAVVGAGCLSPTAGYGKSLFCIGSTVDGAGVVHLVTGLEGQTVFAARAKLGGGFWAATVAKPDELLVDRGYHLFEVTNDGVATLKYDYPKRADFKPALFDYGGTLALDGDARLYRLGALAAAPTVDVVARFDQNAVEIVYTATNATVKATPAFSKLFTGR